MDRKRLQIDHESRAKKFCRLNVRWFFPTVYSTTELVVWNRSPHWRRGLDRELLSPSIDYSSSAKKGSREAVELSLSHRYSVTRNERTVEIRNESCCFRRTSSVKVSSSLIAEAELDNFRWSRGRMVRMTGREPRLATCVRRMLGFSPTIPSFRGWIRAVFLAFAWHRLHFHLYAVLNVRQIENI